MNRELCMQAIYLGKNSDFRAWVDIECGAPKGTTDEPLAKAFILTQCRCNSRKDLDLYREYAEAFKDMVSRFRRHSITQSEPELSDG